MDDGNGNVVEFNFGINNLSGVFATDGTNAASYSATSNGAFLNASVGSTNLGQIIIRVNDRTDASTYPIAFFIGSPAMRIQPQGVAAPTVNDDLYRGYGVNSTWVYDGRVWICKDKNTGAAVWRTTPLITSGTAAPSGGNDGDIYLQYT